MSDRDAMEGAEEQSTAKFRVRVKALDDEVLIRIDREEGTGRPLYETISLTYEEVEALKIALMNETD